MRTHITNIFILGMAVALSLSTQAAELTTVALIAQAQKVSRGGKVEETRAAYEKVLLAKDLTPEQRMAAHMDIARVLRLGRNPELKGAMEEYNTIIALPDLAVTNKYPALLGLAGVHYASNYVDKRGSYHTRGIDAAQKLCEQILTAEDADNQLKIEAAATQAECQLDKMEVDAAVDTLKKALALKGLTEEQKESATFNLAQVFLRSLQYKEAETLLNSLLSTVASPQMKQKISAEYTQLLLKRDGIEAAAAFMKKNGQEGNLATFYSRYGDPEKARAIYKDVLASGTQEEKIASDRARWDAFSSLIAMDKEFMALGDHYLDDFVKTDPKRINILTRFFSRGYIGPYHARDDIRSNPEFLIWVSTKLLNLSREYDQKISAEMRAEVSKHLLNAYLDAGRRKEASTLAKSIAGDDTFGKVDRERFAFLELIIARKANDQQIQAATQKALQLLKTEKQSVVEQVEWIDEIAKVAVRARNNAAAQTLTVLREAIVKPEARRSLNVPFVDNAPQDISSWLASPFITQKGQFGVMDRKYGNNLTDLIATDAAITGRVVGETDTGIERARFSAVCDADGFHLFLLAPCKDAQLVKDGLEATSTYEMYLAPGKNQPYYCYIINGGTGRFSDSFHTMYKNRFYRKPSRDEGTLFTESRATEQGIATYIRFPWDALWDKIPERGDAYEFDSIYWASGGYSWGGSKSVHNRSSFGDLVFSTITEKNRTAIKRRLIKKAYDHYQLQKKGNNNGVLDFWEDPELGDPSFYDACLRDLVTELDTFGKWIKPNMTDAEVNTLYEQAVPRWMEIEYVVADLRTQYMSDTLFSAQ